MTNLRHKFQRRLLEPKLYIEKNLIQYFSFFQPTLESSDPNLKNLGPEVGFSYSSLVLFPETFIHKYEVSKYIQGESE